VLSCAPACIPIALPPFPPFPLALPLFPFPLRSLSLSWPPSVEGVEELIRLLIITFVLDIPSVMVAAELERLCCGRERERVIGAGGTGPAGGVPGVIGLEA
jgi:hypothetical protein